MSIEKAYDEARKRKPHGPITLADLQLPRKTECRIIASVLLNEVDNALREKTGHGFSRQTIKRHEKYYDQLCEDFDDDFENEHPKEVIIDEHTVIRRDSELSGEYTASLRNGLPNFIEDEIENEYARGCRAGIPEEKAMDAAVERVEEFWKEFISTHENAPRSLWDKPLAEPWDIEFDDIIYDKLRTFAVEYARDNPCWKFGGIPTGYSHSTDPRYLPPTEMMKPW